MKFDAGIINFDFLGTFYDYNVAKSGLKDGKADNWNEETIGNFWMKGLLLSLNYYALLLLQYVVQRTGLRPQ